MGAFTDYLEAKILDHVTGKASYTMPDVHLGLATAASDSSVTEVTGTGYARVDVDDLDWESAATGATETAAAIAFPESGGAWSAGADITHIVAYDAATGGNALWYVPLTTARQVAAAGVTLNIPIGEVDITLD